MGPNRVDSCPGQIGTGAFVLRAYLALRVVEASPED